MTLEVIGLDSDFKIEGSAIPSLILEITGTTTLGQKTGGSKSACYSDEVPVTPVNRTLGRNGTPSKSRQLSTKHSEASIRSFQKVSNH
ncbi:MAG: hypothetical protein ACPGLY_12740 [Rubripirellula sp.]